MSNTKKIKAMLETGLAMCKGQVDTFTNSQSAWRQLNRIVSKNKDYYFFYANPKNRGTAKPYKIFFKIKSRVLFDKDSKRLKIKDVAGNYKYSFKSFKNKTAAFKHIKRCDSVSSL